MTFAHPIWLLLPLAVFPAGWWAWIGQNRRAARMARHFPAGMGTPTASLPWSRLAWRFLFLTLLGMALARPQWGDEATEETHSGRDVLFVVDTSRSMLATDTAPNRLECAKLACLDLLRAIPSERIGVIAFAGSAYPVAPLTTDHDAIRETIIGLDTTVLPVAGTNLAPAIEAAADAFKNDPGRRRALVIFSDGEDLEGEWKDVVDLAKKNRMVILAFALGTESGSLLPDSKSEGGFIRDPSGRPVLSKRDTTTLRALADATGGLALPLDPGTPVAATVKETLATLDRGESEKKTRTTAAERFQWPLGAALAVIPFCLLAGRGVRPTKEESRAVVASLVLLAAVVPPPARAEATPPPLEQAYQAHKDGKYDDAIKLGSSALLDRDPKRRATASANFASSLYDAGRTALPVDKPAADDMRKTVRDWEDALDHYDHSLQLRPDPKITANRKVVAEALAKLRQRLQEQEKQEQKQKEQKQQQKDQQGGQGDQKDQQKQDGSQDKQDSQSGRDKPENQDQPGQGQEKSDPKDGGQKDQQGQDKKDETGKEGKDPKEGQGQDGQKEKEKSGQGQENQEGEPKDASSHGSTTREMRPGEEGQVGGARMVVGPDGKLEIPEDPRERARLMEMIRRNLKQRSMEDRTVRLIPKESDPKPTTRKTW